jgi:hypothetical protein
MTIITKGMGAILKKSKKITKPYRHNMLPQNIGPKTSIEKLKYHSDLKRFYEGFGRDPRKKGKK